MKVNKTRRRSSVRKSLFRELPIDAWDDKDEILDAGQEVSQGRTNRDNSWIIFGYENEKCFNSPEKEARLWTEPLEHPRLLAKGFGGLGAFVELDDDNQLTKHMKAPGYVYWVYARVNLKDQQAPTARNSRNQVQIENLGKESVLGSKKYVLIMYKNDVAAGKKKDEEKLHDIKYSMSLRMYAHGPVIRKLFHHHVFIQAYSKSKMFHKFIYSSLANKVTTEGSSIILVVKVKHDETEEYEKARTSRAFRAGSVQGHLVEESENFLPLVKYMKTNQLLIDLKQEVVDSMERRGVIWNTDDVKISVLRNRSNEQVLRSLESNLIDDDDLHTVDEMIQTHPNARDLRNSMTSRASTLPPISSLVSFVPLSDDGSTLEDLNLRSGDEILVEHVAPIVVQNVPPRNRSFFSFGNRRSFDKTPKPAKSPIVATTAPTSSGLPPRPAILLNPQLLLRKKKDLDMISAVRSLDHSDMMRMKSSRKMSKTSERKQLDLKKQKRQSIARKRELVKVCREIGANFIETSDILITNKKPLGVGKTAQVYEGLLRCSIADDNLNKSKMFKGIKAIEAMKSQKVVIKSDGQGEIKSILHRMRGPRALKSIKKKPVRKTPDLDGTSLTFQPLEIAVRVAVKRFTARLVTESVARVFLQEIQALCRFKHDGVVRCLGIYVDDDDHEAEEVGSTDSNLQLLIVYELCTRGDLKSLIKEQSWRGVPFRTRFLMVFPAASALAEIHGTNIVHRDLKIDNILVSETFTLKIGDFGVAKVLNRAMPVDVEAGAGTLGYTAPEVVSGLSQGTKESDVFSFGVILYMLAADYKHKDDPEDAQFVPKTNPFLKPLDDYIDQFEDDKHLDSLAFHPRLPKLFTNMVKQCLRNDPTERCSADEIVAVLTKLLPKDKK